MKLVFGQYEHSTLGFPKVKLKWTVENDEITASYVTVKGIIEDVWTFYHQYPLAFMEDECKRFDEYVRTRFHNDGSVQG